jgi:triosephosphate isomerase
LKIICFPHFYCLSEVSRLVETGKALRALGQDILFFSHGGYEYVAREVG